MSKTSKNPNSTLRLVVTLFAITAITSALLGVVNLFTSDIIFRQNQEKKNAAMEMVLPESATGYTYEELEYTGSDAIVSEVYKANSQSASYYVVLVNPSGFGGTIEMAVGINEDLSVAGVSIISMSETSGLGDNASSPDFLTQYIGRSGKLAVTRDGGEIDALTGATITSRAVTQGVNSALDAVSSMK